MTNKLGNAATLGGFIIVTVTTFGLAFSGQRSADAFPKYSKKEGKPCSYCHVNASGGGKNNATGKWYKAHGLTFVGYTPEKAAAEFSGAAGTTAPAGVTGSAPKPSPKPSAKPAVKGEPAAKPKPSAKPAPKKK